MRSMSVSKHIEKNDELDFFLSMLLLLCLSEVMKHFNYSFR